MIKTAAFNVWRQTPCSDIQWRAYRKAQHEAICFLAQGSYLCISFCLLLTRPSRSLPTATFIYPAGHWDFQTLKVVCSEGFYIWIGMGVSEQMEFSLFNFLQTLCRSHQKSTRPPSPPPFHSDLDSVPLWHLKTLKKCIFMMRLQHTFMRIHFWWLLLQNTEI